MSFATHLFDVSKNQRYLFERLKTQRTTHFLHFLIKHINIIDDDDGSKFIYDMLDENENTILRDYLMSFDFGKKERVDDMKIFLNFLKQQEVGEEEVRNWVKRNVNHLASLALYSANENYIEFLLTDLPFRGDFEFWRKFINFLLEPEGILRRNNSTDGSTCPAWVLLLPIFTVYADNKQMSTFIDELMYEDDEEMPTISEKYNAWSEYVNYSIDKNISRKVDKLLESVSQKLGPSCVINLVTFSPSDKEDDTVIVRAALNKENDLVEAMFAHLNATDRQKVEKTINKYRNNGKDE